jgi:hypothetical protein
VSKLKVSTFLMLDGVMQAPGDAGEFDRGGWQIQFFDDGAGAIAKGVSSRPMRSCSGASHTSISQPRGPR